jgi:signal transduction histidine kinase
MKILVAEDNPQSLYLLEQYFVGRGHEVWSARDGRAALALCRERGAPDVIVSDALMPSLDGFELCDAVRRDPALAALPFVLYTATYTAESDERLARSIGVDRFVVKPIEPDHLLDIVEKAVAELRSKPPRVMLPTEPRPELLQEYARTVSVKLEDKLAEISRAHAALQSSEESVRQLNKRLLAAVGRLEQEIEERRQTTELLRLAQRVGGIGTWECDAAGTLRWSEEAVLLLRDSRGAPPASFVEFIGGLVADDRARAEAVLLANPEPEVLELEVRYGPTPGSARHLLLRGGRQPSPCDQPQRRIGIVQDVTARIEAEARRQILEQQLFRSQKMEALGNLAGGIAHDFNNILTAIMGHADLLKLELPRLTSAPEIAASVNVIADAAQRAREIIKQILSFSRQQSVERKALLFSRVVESALRLVRSTIGKTIEVRCQLESDRYVIANESQIHQVLLNLCTNAAQAMRSGGVITVALTSVDLSSAEAENHPGLHPGPHVRLDVSDSGVGIRPAVLEHIFEPFFTTKPEGEGTGLGLAVVHGIVQSHDGAITVDSQSGRGTTFSLFFPAVAGREVPTQQMQNAGFPTGSGQRVLVVDDEPSVARTCAQLLERLGYLPTAMTDPIEARELFEREPQAYTVAVVDFLMPGLTGVDLARALWSKQPTLPVILVAGFGTQMDATRARADGFCDFLAKPFALTTLADALARATR